MLGTLTDFVRAPKYNAPTTRSIEIDLHNMPLRSDRDSSHYLKLELGQIYNLEDEVQSQSCS